MNSAVARRRPGPQTRRAIWLADESGTAPVTADVFGTAPRELTSAITLRQTLDLIRSVVDVVEDEVHVLAVPGDEQAVREGVLRYSREIAFAAVQVYAQAAEARGAWDARLEALVVDAVLRGEADDSMQSRATALGWGSVSDVTVVAGRTPSGSSASAVDAIRRAAARRQVEALTAVQGRRLVEELGRVAIDADGLAAADGWPQAPRPVSADELLPERVLVGDVHARRVLVERIATPLRAHEVLLDTATAYLDSGGLESAARVLFVHPNTVRYRLGKIAELTGYDLTHPRDGYAVRLALALARLSGSPPAARRPVPTPAVPRDGAAGDGIPQSL